MFKHGFPPEWSTFKKLIWLVGSGIAGAAAGIWKTVTGALIHITDALASPMQKCEVTLEPKQDLHGQDSPYPAGGGKNLWGDLKMAEDIHSAIPAYSTIDTTNKTVSIVSAGAITRVVLFSGIFKENTRYTFIASGTFDSADRFNFKFAYTDDTTSATFVNGANVSDAGKTVSAVIAWQYTGTSYLKYEECGLFEGNVSASDFAPYSNICPITGWTGCEVNVTGENLLAEVNTPCFIPLESGTKVTVVSNAAGVVYYYDKSMTQIDYWSVQGSGDYWKKTFALLQNAYYFKFVPSSQQSVNVALYKGDIASPTYKPFGTTASVTFPDGLINQWDEEWELGYYDIANGKPASSSSYIRSKSTDYIPVNPSTEYYVYSGSLYSVITLWYDINKNYISYTGGANQVRTSPANAAFTRFYVGNSAYGTTYKNDISINYPATVTDYHPYHDDVVYGCMIDFVSGLLTVTHKYASLTGLVWSGNVNNTLAIEAYTHSISGKKKGATNIISDKLKTISPFINKAEYTVRGFAQDGDIAVKIPKAVASDYTELKTWVDNNDVHVCFELDEPFTIQLTPQQIGSLRGMNNIWSNSNGATTIIYKAKAE